MSFCWLVAFLNNCISTKDYWHFESFRFFNQEITLVAGLAVLYFKIELTPAKILAMFAIGFVSAIELLFTLVIWRAQ